MRTVTLDTIEHFCARQVADLDRERQRLLWLWSNAYYRWREEYIPWVDPVEQGVADEV
jgi:hypothetical protein